MASFHPMRIQQLDVLRAVAVFLVLGHHLAINGLWFRIGWSGVDLFFVLSGFLVSGLLFREYLDTGGLRVGRFLARRGLKIYPAYYLVLLLSAAYLAAGGRIVEPGSAVDSPSRTLVDAVFLQNYVPGTWGHLWSLAVEEHFYILLPLVFSLLIRFRRRNPLHAVPVVCAVPMVACLAFRTAHYFSGRPLLLASATHFRMDSLAFGVLIAYFHHFHPAAIDRLLVCRGRVLLAAGLACVSFAALGRSHPLVFTFGYSVIYLGYGALLIYCLNVLRPAGKWGRMVANAGRYSYTIYLFHPIVLAALQRIPGLDGAPAIMAYFFGAGAVGVIAAKAVELPALRLRDRLFPSEASGRMFAGHRPVAGIRDNLPYPTLPAAGSSC